jgi:hypothetical protein
MFPKVASVANYDGIKQDYSAPRDSTTDRTAAGTNPMNNDVAAMTHCAPRAWARLTVKSAGTTPVLVAHDEGWNNGNASNTAPVAARSSAGVLTLTYPSTVFDEIPASAQGATAAGFTVNLRGGWGNDRGGTTWNNVKVIPTAANVLTIYVWRFAGGVPTLGDPIADTDIDIYAL